MALTSVVKADPVGPYLPWGIHMAYGNDPTTAMTFVWSTRLSTRSSTIDVTSQTSGKTSTFFGNSTVYSDSNNVQTIHTTYLTDLEPGVEYNYTVGDEDGNRSSTRTFSLHPVNGGTWKGDRDYPILTIYGDMGVAVNAHKSLPLLYNDLADGKMDVILHIGDIAYDLQSQNGASGDAFVVQTEPLASAIPIHYCPGKREIRFGPMGHFFD